VVDRCIVALPRSPIQGIEKPRLSPVERNGTGHGPVHPDHDFEDDFEGIRIRRNTRSTENTRAARSSMENDGLIRPALSRDT